MFLLFRAGLLLFAKLVQTLTDAYRNQVTAVLQCYILIGLLYSLGDEPQESRQLLCISV